MWCWWSAFKMLSTRNVNLTPLTQIHQLCHCAPEWNIDRPIQNGVTILHIALTYVTCAVINFTTLSVIHTCTMYDHTVWMWTPTATSFNSTLEVSTWTTAVAVLNSTTPCCWWAMEPRMKAKTTGYWRTGQWTYCEICINLIAPVVHQILSYSLLCFVIRFCMYIRHLFTRLNPLSPSLLMQLG